MTRSARWTVLATAALVAVPLGVPAFAAGLPTATPTPTPTVTSPPLAVPSALAIATSAGRVRYGSAVDVIVRLTDPIGQPLAGRAVVLYVGRRGSGTYAGLAQVVTDAAGQARYRHVPQYDAVYTARYRGSSDYAAAAAGDRIVTVTPVLWIGMSTVTMPITSTATLVGRLGPVRPGAPVYLQRYRDGGWYTEQQRALDADSRFSFAITPTATGTYSYRAVANNTFVSSLTAQLTVVPRVLRQGMRGSDVLAIQRRLAALRYDVGAISGYYGYDTHHAVMAFQKVQGLRRDGQVGATTSTALGRPVAPRLRYSHSGTSVEADLTKQVLYIARDGVIVRVLNISSGNGEYYTVDGITSRAVTPIGNFRIQRKIDGLRVSRLGELYRPAYFTSTGYAVHGSPSVPAYPASHGCIRITNPSMDRVFSMLPIGAPVHVYRS